ncbi:hypothetical protein [Knoellia aerolata]|uniref:CHAT domain-containing protein n=1 Tax=Knoellia aerolata DSM 18566 TaxID=1385519 RepID=A0A0A0JWU8_9MICO|nr:hypothetical protein [Knoellia aerolata]KGN41184.1 hypothetical protein N801_08870 [Knoellia aerolata DSM 18566]
MRNRTVTLVDLGLDAPFNASMQFVQATLDNLNEGGQHPIVDVNFVRSRDQETLWAALTTPSTVLHVMAHGDHSDEPVFLSSDEKTEITLSYLAEHYTGLGTGVAAPIVIADGCKTGVGVWQRAIRDSLQDSILYIGTTKAVGWYEGTVFASAFYGSLLRRRGRGLSALDQGRDAVAKASDAFTTVTGRKCPYQGRVLSPSRRAITAGAKR